MFNAYCASSENTSGQSCRAISSFIELKTCFSRDVMVCICGKLVTYNKNGILVHHVSCIRDITEGKAAQQNWRFKYHFGVRASNQGNFILRNVQAYETPIYIYLGHAHYLGSKLEWILCHKALIPEVVSPFDHDSSTQRFKVCSASANVRR